MEDYHRQVNIGFIYLFCFDDDFLKDVAASCIFLATKTEECGRKLRDVAIVFCAKITGIEVTDDSKVRNRAYVCIRALKRLRQDLEDAQSAILLAEEALLDALCFDFVVLSPQVELTHLLEAREEDRMLEDLAWCIANDS